MTTEYFSLQHIYLGQGITLRRDAWRTLRTTKPLSTFAAGAALVIWKKELPYFCLDLKKVKKIIPGEKSIQLFCPNKLELFLGEILLVLFLRLLLICHTYQINIQ